MVAERVSLVADEKLLTAEEYFATCHLEHSELMDGKVVKLMPPGAEHGELAVNIALPLKLWVRTERLGRVYVETGYVLQRNPDIVRSPDVSFMEISRLPQGRSQSGFLEGAPTLAVEVVSPGDSWSEVEEKVRLYLENGSTAVWIVEPEAQTVTVRTLESARTYGAQSTLRGEPALPAFEIELREVFES